MSASIVSAEVLAAGLAARLVHDLSGPASGVSSGLELCAEGGDPGLKDEGLALAAASAGSLLAALAYDRLAFAGAGEPQDGAALERLVEAQFGGRRTRFEWSLSIGEFGAAATQSLLILAQIAASGLGRGGVIRIGAAIAGEAVVIGLEGEGARTTLHPEALEGLAGRPLACGLAGRWAPGYFLHALVQGRGGEVSVQPGETAFRLQVRLPRSAA